MHRAFMIPALTALALGLAYSPAQAQTFTVMTGCAQVQEDWKLVIAKGDPVGNGPQIMTYMSPASDSSQPYVWFMLNVRDAPNPFTPGGLMIQVWNYSDSLLTSSTSTQATAQLNTAGETITWTQRLTYNPRTYQSTYDIINGSSTTWGAFGSSNGLAAITGTASFTSLAGYSPYVSVKNSRVAFQPNNVTSMTLVAVRQYDKGGNLIQSQNINLAVNLTPQ